MSDSNNKLANQKDALIDYIDALVTEASAQIKIPEKFTVYEENNNVSTFKPLLGDKKEILEKITDLSDSEQFIEVCVFTVSGLKLAIPNDKISDVIALSEKIALVDNKLLQAVSDFGADRATVSVINTSLLVMPDSGWSRPNKIILMKDNHIGLTCDDVVESLKLDKNDVRWRTNNTKRRWLAGTVITRQMALLDVDKIIEDIVDVDTM